MPQSEPTRRDVLRWIVSCVTLAPVVANATSQALSSWANAPASGRSGLLFRDHLPPEAKQLVSKSTGDVYAAVYEVTERESELSWSTTRWLCVAHEVSPGRFAVQTSQEAVASSSNWHPVDVTLSLSEGGVVHVREEGLRWHSNHTWKRSAGHWQLESRDSVGVSGLGEIYEERYDQLRQEVVLSRGRIDDENPLASTRHAASETFALADYTRGPLV